MNVLGVIPARYQSIRFPGKPLADICGKPMIWRVFQQARKAKKVRDIIVATDDRRIFDVCMSHSIPCVMTGEHENPPNRIWEVAQIHRADFYVCINGDEPLIDPSAIDAAVLDDIPCDDYATNTIASCNDAVGVMDTSNIKVTFDDNFKALYMSRTPIPFPFGGINFQYYKHIGVVGMTASMLEWRKKSTPGRFEMIEGIDTLRFIDYGKWLQFCPVDISESLSVDTPQDLDKVRRMFIERGGGGGYE